MLSMHIIKSQNEFALQPDTTPRITVPRQTINTIVRRPPPKVQMLTSESTQRAVGLAPVASMLATAVHVGLTMRCDGGCRVCDQESRGGGSSLDR